MYAMTGMKQILLKENRGNSNCSCIKNIMDYMQIFMSVCTHTVGCIR